MVILLCPLLHITFSSTNIIQRQHQYKEKKVILQQMIAFTCIRSVFFSLVKIKVVQNSENINKIENEITSSQC